MRSTSLHRYAYLLTPLAWIAAAWVGCAQPIDNTTTTASSSTSSSGKGGAGGTGGSGGGTGGLDFDAGSGSGGEGGACVSTSSEGRRVPVDMLFLIDRSSSMTGPKWDGTKAALTAFFEDPSSAGISAGMVYFPAENPEFCNPQVYSVLDVPIGVLPANSFALTNSLPFTPLGTHTPTFPGLAGALKAATAYQDLNPSHKVVVVLATDGEPTSCPPIEIEPIAALALNARSYNGVRTYVIGIEGSKIGNLDKIAAAGGTTKAYDITQNIAEFSAKIAEIRKEALACDFVIPDPPNGGEIDPNQVNFTYTPKGLGSPKILPQADNLADCNGQAGWYYDNNLAPNKIILCPSSCATVAADEAAKVNVLFGCKTIIN